MPHLFIRPGCTGSPGSRLEIEVHFPRTPGRIAAPLMIAAALAVATACSSSSTSDSTPSAEPIAGSPNKAAGTPVTIGFISEGKSPAIDNTDEIKGARAAVAYANDYLGGLGGHPITLKVCESLGQPATATDCANQMVAADVAAVVEGVEGQIDATIAPLAAAKIPLVTHTASTQAALQTPGVFMLLNGLSYFGTPAAQAKADGVKKADLVVIGVPAAEGPARQIGALLYGNAGVGLNVTAVPPGTADMTPQIAAADGEHPDLYTVVGNDTFCTSALKAIKTVDPSVKTTIIDRCITPGGASAIPGGYQDINVVTTTDLSKDRPDGKLFASVLGKYGDGAKFGSTAAFGYSPMLGMVDALNAAKISEPTPATVTSTLQSAPATEYPLSGGVMFQCNGKQIALSPNICSTDGIMATADKAGTLSNYRRVAADAKLYSMPGR